MSRHRNPSVASDNRRRVALFTLATALVVALAAAAGLMLLRPQEPGPRDAVEAWLTAATAGDVERQRLLTCAAGAAGLGAEQSTSVAWAVTAETSADDTALVTADVTYTVEGFLQHDTWTFDVVREGEEWRYCGLTGTLTSPDTPRTALTGWMRAATDGDLATVRSLTCATQAGGLTSDEIARVRQDGIAYEITAVSKVDEARAEVAFTVTVTRNGGPVDFDERWAFVHEGEAWKACGPVGT
jgi:hypothetical protein